MRAAAYGSRQGLRALAVALVVLDHAGVPGCEAGFVGVDMFFVISGFVITLALYRELRTSGTLNLRRFYLRRFRRLTPALSLMLGVTVAVSVVMTSPFGVLTATVKTALGATFFGANFVLAALSGGYFAVRSQLNPLLHTWSLSVEEQFYFLFPLLLLVTYVVAHTANYWTVGERIVPAGEHLTVDRDAATSAYRAALSRTVAMLRDAGHQVIVVNTVPMYWFQPTYFDPMACPAFRIASGDCYGTKTRQQYDSEQGFLDAVTTEVMGTYGGQAITPAETLCPGGLCTTMVDGKQLYRDTDHLTIDGSLLLKEPLRAALTAQPADVTTQPADITSP